MKKYNIIILNRIPVSFLYKTKGSLCLKQIAQKPRIDRVRIINLENSYIIHLIINGITLQVQ